jgi:hypothetical protein
MPSPQSSLPNRAKRGEARFAIAAIATTSYLPHAATLAASLAAAHPDTERVLLWVDPPAGVRLENAAGRLGYRHVIVPQELVAAERLAGMRARYSDAELCFALKPLLLCKMLDSGCASAIYLDTDVFVYAGLTPVFEALAGNSIALTPHITEPLPDDDRLPRDLTILRAGAFNLGFIGVRNTPEARRFLDWWAARESRYGYVDPVRGWGGDQKWCDMVPALFDNVAILKNPGYNVAYWNLPSRRLSRVQGEWFAGGEPLVFFHFSGFDPGRPGVLSRFQDRIDPLDDPFLSQLLADHAVKMHEGEGRVADFLHPIGRPVPAGPASCDSQSPPDLDGSLIVPLEESVYATSVQVSPREVFAEPGECVVLKIEMRNCGEQPLWIAAHSDGIHGVGLAFHWLRGNGEVLKPDNPRRYYPDPVPAGETTIVDFVYRVPNECGHFVLEFDLVHDGFRWFHPKVDDAARVEIFAGIHRGAK